ncbi:hypothetical protein J2T17_004352 [Paenibacillus mucilaginosus]|uniref:hypothetical protein n=1 Tax=Paenibacillus mucilaginosus TaxID=61624 RepID=UPI003D24B488
MLFGLDQMEAGMLLTKYCLVLSMLTHGSEQQKRFAKEELVLLEQELMKHLDPAAIKMAALTLDFTQEEMDLLEIAV